MIINGYHTSNDYEAFFNLMHEHRLICFIRFTCNWIQCSTRIPNYNLEETDRPFGLDGSDPVFIRSASKEEFLRECKQWELHFVIPDNKPQQHPLNLKQLDNLSRDELKSLGDEINHRLKNKSFWETIDSIDAMNKKIRLLTIQKEKIALSNTIIKQLNTLGFTLVIYSTEEERVGFLKFDSNNDDDKYCGFYIENNPNC